MAIMTSIGQPQVPSLGEGENAFSLEIRSGLDQLLKARNYAGELDCDPWEFAVEIERLINLGLTTSDLRWLVKKGIIEHAREVTQPDDSLRKFQQCHNLAFAKKSCFLLTETAALSLENTYSPQELSKPENTSSSDLIESDTPPHWDCEDRVLYVGNLVVKEYRVLSPNQEAVLSAFEEEGWPHYIDDPLSPVPDQNPKQRLRDTIRCLNANQRNQLVRFRGDGTGERVRWEFISSSSKKQARPFLKKHSSQ
jgi:hypothetical protein